MWDLIFKAVEAVLKIALPAIAVGAAVGATIYIIANWPEISNKISSWLDRNNLDRSALMDAFVIFERIVTNSVYSPIRRFIVVVTKQTGRQTIEEEELSSEEVQRRDPDLYKELQKRTHVEINIMKQIQ